MGDALRPLGKEAKEIAGPPPAFGRRCQADPLYPLRAKAWEGRIVGRLALLRVASRLSMFRLRPGEPGAARREKRTENVTMMYAGQVDEGKRRGLTCS